VPAGADFALFDTEFTGLLNVLFFSDPPAHATLIVRKGQVQFDLAGHTYTTLSTFGVIVGDTAFSDPSELSISVGEVETSSTLIGLVADSTGELHLLSSTQWSASGQMLVGWFGEGVLEIDGTDGQSALSTNGGQIGAQEGSQGFAFVEGSFGQWTNVGDLVIGDAGAGTLTISSFGTVSTTTLTTLGEFASAHGTLVVSGPGSSLSSGSAIRVGNLGAGSMTIEDGGSVSTMSNGIVCFGAGSTGDVVITGAGSMWDCTGGVTVGQAGDGSVTVADGGLLEGNSVQISASGELHGDGSVSAVNVSNAGHVSPGLVDGDSTGTLTIDGNYLAGGGGTLAVEIGGTGSGAFDALGVSGNADLSGTLEVTLIGGPVLEIGDEFPVITAGSVSGEFLSESVPDLPNAVFCVVYGPASVTLRVVSPADLTCDAQVGVDDLLILLGAWGTPFADITGDGTTDVDDLLALLGAWD
jgi:T5SS/PEP-CTERM-associated repeat protein